MELLFHTTRVVGSALIMIGLYSVIWGKKKEVKDEEKKLTTATDPGIDIVKNTEMKATNGVDHGVDFGSQIIRDDMGLELSMV